MKVEIHVPDDRTVDEFMKEHTLFVLLTDAIFSATIQIKRLNRSIVGFDIDTRCQNLFFVDNHFFLVSVTNIMKVLESMKKGRFSKDGHFVEFSKKYIKLLEPLDRIRDHLEHIVDGRLEGYKNQKKTSTFTVRDVFGLFKDKRYQFNDDSYSLEEAFQIILDLKNDLKIWNKGKYFVPEK